MKDITLKQLQKAIKQIDGLTIGNSKMSDRYFMKFIEQVETKANNLDNLSSLGKLLSKDFRNIKENNKLKVIYKFL